VDAFGEVAFTLGTIFSALLTLLPAAFLLSVGAYKMAFHGRMVADGLPECPVPPGGQVASFPKDLPASILNDFHTHVPKLAGAGQRFNATDVVTVDRPSRRLIFVRHLGPRWVIAYEHGGFAYHDHIVAYQISADGDAKLVFNIAAFPETVCTAASSWLVGEAPNAGLFYRSDGHW
jgi:hypothetical protein